jgi:hypothetical protein
MVTRGEDEGRGSRVEGAETGDGGPGTEDEERVSSVE